MRSLKIGEAEAGRRLDRYLIRYFDLAPASFVYKNLRKKKVRLCGRIAKGDEILASSDVIELYFSDEVLLSASSSFGGAGDAGRRENESGGSAFSMDTDISPDIVYEDQNIIIVSKKAGMLSQKGKAGDLSVNDILLGYSRAGVPAGKTSDGDIFIPSICNRLDRNTSGLITFARTYKAAKELGRVFREKKVRKVYLAVSAGSGNGSVSAVSWLVKDHTHNKVSLYEREIPGSLKTVTSWQFLGNAVFCGRDVSLVRVEPATGRPHQIRAQMAKQGFPLLGDTKYGDPDLNRIVREHFPAHVLFLHSWSMSMPEGMPEPLEDLSGRTFTACPPDYFGEIFPETFPAEL